MAVVVVSEMLPLRLRGKVVALGVLVNRLASGVVALTFLSLSRAVGGFFAAFLLYAALGVLTTVFYAAAVPESMALPA